MYDEEIEKAVLYYIIFEKEELSLSEKDFFLQKNKQIYKAIRKLKEKKEEISILTIQQKIKSNDKEVLKYLSDLANNVFGTSVEYAYKKLKDLSKKRELLEVAKEIEKNAVEEEAENYIKKIIKRLADINSEGQKEKSFIDMLVDTVNEIEKKILQGANFQNPYLTGIFDLDAVTNGLHPEEFTVIGARPGIGKTTLALQIASKIAEKGIAVGIISLEMSDTQLIQKIISREANVDSNKLRLGNLDNNEQDKISLAIGEITTKPFFINTRARSIQDIELYARRLKNKNDLGLLIVDYLQLVKSKNKFNSREQEVAEISRSLKLLSLELQIPIIGLCQLNRNAARTTIPTLADLRESGAIEQDADNVIFLYKENDDDEEPKMVENVVLDLQKQRAGGLTKVVVRFDKKTSRFMNLAKM